MTSNSGLISGLSVSHQRASLDQLEAAAADSQQSLVADLCAESAVREAYALQTCNRVEAYVVTDGAETGRELLAERFAETPEECIRELGHEESLEHLLRVSAGLESLVLGEDQILGQVRDAYEDARTVDGIGPILEDGVTKAIHVGERARTETAINEGVVSLASAAVRLAAEKHGLDGASAAVIGAGEMGQLAAKRLAPRVGKLVLANRTIARANSVAKSIEEPVALETTGLDDLGDTIDGADILIAATASTEWIVEADTLADVSETFVIDITRPRDIPPAADEFEHLTVYDLDRLESVTEKTRQMRREAAEEVEEIVDEEFELLLDQYKRKRADQVISAMYESAERVKARELEKTFAKLDLDEESEAVVESMADTLVSQLLAPPTNSLRDAAADDDWTTIHTALRLFNPNIESAEEAALAGMAPDGMPESVDASDPEAIPDHVREQLPAGLLEELDD
ncbi:glutamyl-tRNA reductase [Halovenus sp. WSH3]|uniref:Glutamyl-tRNA reductase n=1 Tax=Halovenus carboxidivorans TaxID=2692199 RepID=A0A6B0T113_9EURY|nr:glutamyl-tRNA reductase [Halovenus carboxidivorans]MXR50877.1 glutamyl-tRNA reductase [Halovenus carboxidivorans]